jgi:hypothetical protein
MAETTEEAESPPKVSMKAQTKGSLKAGLTSTVVVEKASQNKRLKADCSSMGPATDGAPEGS